MPPDNLSGKIRQAYLPYVRAFLNHPAEARLVLAIFEDAVEGTLQLDTTDFNRFNSTSGLRIEQRRAFNNLVRRLTNETKGPSLDFERR